MDKERLAIFVGVLVAIIWAITSMSVLLIRDYTSLEIVTPVMLLVCGFLFGYGAAVKRNGH